MRVWLGIVLGFLLYAIFVALVVGIFFFFSRLAHGRTTFRGRR